ncbi:unnamed protein product [Cylindrotheca closterium]|uniref:Geranylgeranyl transferase type-2 subunit alpha n=1 Tax=Cylindrotheca closterium TaxID=2856 RepID=A0AAD2FTZ8_9STRA|nr:unnamed protein product [Cylindrotheca closterium]
MHGRNREDYKAKFRDPKVAAGLEKKAQQWYTLMDALIEARKADNSKEKDKRKGTIDLIEKALLVNPDPLNLWNHRRELLVLEREEMENTDPMLKNELDLTQAALQRNPKAYGSWFHRKWILALLQPDSSVLQNELKLTAQFLTLDERNFHCWNYRRFVVSALASCWNGGWELPSMGPQIGASVNNSAPSIPQDVLEAEWDFTHQKIQHNFSNFSAFHYRSQLLPRMIAQKGDEAAILEEELQVVENAIFTEPDDQTAWWYHKLLLLEYKFEPSRLEEQAEMLRELLEDSPGKWVLVGLFEILSVLGTRKEERCELLKRLITLDQDRSTRYRELLEKLESE